MGLLPVLSGLAGQQLASAHAASVSSMSTPSRLQDDAYSSPPMSPSSSDNELHQFLVALLAKKHVDLLDAEEKLAADDYTPDILHAADLARLKELTGATDGKIIKMQVFAREWSKRKEEKRRA